MSDIMPMSDDGYEYDNYQDDIDNEYQEEDDSNRLIKII
jgi:hypothetical protein